MRIWPLLLILAAGCTTELDTLSTTESAIIGGTRSTGNTATFLLVGWPQDKSVISTCTAVLVAPTIALTSAHCIDTPNHPNYSYGIFPGDDAAPYPYLVDLEPHLLPVTSVHPHPMYSTALPFFADIGVVQLANALPVAPLPMRRTPVTTAMIGMPALIVGYGQIEYGEYNSTRYEATTTVAAVDNDTVVVGDMTKRACLGDSGGPAIVGGELIGIDSYGPTGCASAAHYRRVDYFLPFIDQYAPPVEEGSGSGSGSGDPVEPGDDDDEEGGGCSTTGGSGGLALVLGVALAARRRRVTAR